MDRRAVPQEADVQLLHPVEVGAPHVVVAALLHLVHPDSPPLDGGVTVLNPRRKHESRSHSPHLPPTRRPGRFYPFCLPAHLYPDSLAGVRTNALLPPRGPRDARFLLPRNGFGGTYHAEAMW